MSARVAIGLLVAALIALVLPGAAAAEILNVTTTADHDDKFCTVADCTLREAVQVGGSEDTINVPSGNYVLTMSTELVLSADTIVGVGARTTFIDGGDKTRVLRVAGEGTSRVSGVTIRNGNGASTTSNGSGGGIFQQSATLMLDNVTVSGNNASTVGGGGVVVAAGTLTMIGSTLSGNTAGTGRLTRAGGIFVNTGANVLLGNATVSGNIARDTTPTADASEGGGIYAAGNLVLLNVTIAGNTAASGGGLYQQPRSATGGPAVATNMSNTILAGNSGAECAGPGIPAPSAITSHHDVVDDGSCMLTGAGERQDVNPLLGALANNGGQTDTRALAVNSPAIDVGSGCAALDQRGVTRPGGSACDVGAFEFMPPTLAVTTTVINDNGGTRNASGFLVHVKQGAVEAPKSPQNGNANGFTFTLTPGAYTVSVDDVAGYSATISGDCDAKGDVTLAENQAKACTITLNDIAPRLTVVTTVVNDNGGTRLASGFSAHVKAGATDVPTSPQPGSATGTTYTLNAGTYAVSADPVFGYAITVSTGCGAAVLAVGDVRTCTITANDVAPTLSVVTTVVNDNGGTRLASGFSAHVRSGTSDVPTSPQPGSATGTTYTLPAGTYAVSGDAVTGYALSVSVGCGAVVLVVGDAKTCTITANDVAPTLTVVTTVVNDNGGTRLASGFSAHVRSGASDVTGSPQPGSATGTTYTLNAGTYAVSADSVIGYALSVSAGCGAAVLAVGDTRTCTITANDIAPRLRVSAVVVNDSGGTSTVGDFLVHVRSGATEVSGSPQPGSGAGTLYTLPAGSYAVSGDGVAGYAATVSAPCAANGAITLVVGDEKTCTITFNDGAPTLEVITQVVTDDGGTKAPTDFNVHVKSGAVGVGGSPQAGDPAGTIYSLTAGGYTVSADAVPGYTTSTSGDCAADGSVTLQVGQAQTCTVTANDVAPTLTVVKQVVNDNGGTRAPGDFSLHVTRAGAEVAGSPAPGTASGRAYTLSAGTYAMSEDAVQGYVGSISGACDASGTVTLAEGDAKTCTITNDDVAQLAGPRQPLQLPPPVARESVNALPKSGTVKVKLPGSDAFVLLEEGRQIPVGTIVDATKGRVTLVAAADGKGGTATADFYGGIFRVGQTSGATPTTTLKLVEKLSCATSGKASAAAKRKKKRRLWGDGQGKFRTDGSYSSATVRGTKWLVQDSCTSTLTKVRTGRVAVRDFAKRKTVIVRAGKQYIARRRG